MRMMKLLSAVKSLVGQNDGDKRYRMSDPKAMPRFGSERNPLLKKANATLPGSTSVSPAGCGSAATGMHAGETLALPAGRVLEGQDHLKATQRGAGVSGEQVGSPLTSVLRLFGRATAAQGKAEQASSPKPECAGASSLEDQATDRPAAASISNDARTPTNTQPRCSGLFAGWIATLRAIFSRGDRSRSSRPQLRPTPPVQGEL